MPDAFIAFTQLAPDSALVGLVVFGVLAIGRGWLVPRRSIDQLLHVQGERLAEARQREQEWRAAWEASEEARRIEAEHSGDVLEGLRTVEALVRALPPAARGGGPM